jgi:hypothetical protein
MLGLRAEHDRNFSIARLESSFARNSKFADNLKGRFFVAGISGSFQNYDRQVKEIKSKVIRPPRYDHQPVLERKQREDLRKEAEQLIELEQKLAEVNCLPLIIISKVILIYTLFNISIATTTKDSKT